MEAAEAAAMKSPEPAAMETAETAVESAEASVEASEAAMETTEPTRRDLFDAETSAQRREHRGRAERSKCCPSAVRVPHRGSPRASLVFDTLAKEAQRQLYENFSGPLAIQICQSIFFSTKAKERQFLPLISLSPRSKPYCTFWRNDL